MPGESCCFADNWGRPAPADTPPLVAEVRRQREHDAFIAEFAVIEEHGIERQYLVAVRKQIADLIRRGS